jgi:hypothetical protein
VIILIRGLGQLSVARAVAALYEWSVTLAYDGEAQRAMICGSDERRAWIPGMTLDPQALYSRALLHHGWGADCVLCPTDDDRREQLMRSAGLEVRVVRVMDERSRRTSKRVRSAEDATREIGRWLGVST